LIVSPSGETIILNETKVKTQSPFSQPRFFPEIGKGYCNFRLGAGAFYTSLPPKKTGFTQDAEQNYSGG
jgi:hypothetical protein